MKKYTNNLFIRKFMQLYNFVFIKLNKMENYRLKEKSEFDSSINSIEYCTAVGTCWLYMLKKLIILFQEDFNCEEYNFLDVGCGYGVPLVFVKKKFNFKSVSGFDLLEECVERSRQNIKKSGNSNVNVFQANAKNFKLDDKKYFIFMFNPFDKIIMDTFMQNNIEVLNENKCIIAYINQLTDTLKIIESFPHKKIVTNASYKMSLVSF